MEGLFSCCSTSFAAWVSRSALQYTGTTLHCGTCGRAARHCRLCQKTRRSWCRRDAVCEPQSNPGSRTRWIVLAALVLCALNIGAHFPRTLNTDSVEQYREVLAGRLVDWHPPVMAFVWSLMPRVWGGPQRELTCWSSNSRATHGRTDAGSPAAKHEGLTYIVARELT